MASRSLCNSSLFNTSVTLHVGVTYAALASTVPTAHPARGSTHQQPDTARCSYVPATLNKPSAFSASHGSTAN